MSNYERFFSRPPRLLKNPKPIRKARIRQRNGKFYKIGLVNGYPCLCYGNTKEELQRDIEAAEKTFTTICKNICK